MGRDGYYASTPLTRYPLLFPTKQKHCKQQTAISHENKVFLYNLYLNKHEMATLDPMPKSLSFFAPNLVARRQPILTPYKRMIKQRKLKKKDTKIHSESAPKFKDGPIVGQAANGPKIIQKVPSLFPDTPIPAPFGDEEIPQVELLSQLGSYIPQFFLG